MTEIEYQDAIDVASIKMHDSDELAYVINRNKTIKDTTKKQYRTAYKKWQSTTERQVIDCSEQSIIDILEKVACAPNTKNNVVSVIVLIRKHHGLPIEKVRNWRDVKLKKIIDVAHTAADKVINAYLPCYTELNDYVKKLYKEKNWRDYIINYILSRYCVRNRDLNVFITQDRSIMKRAGDEDNVNIMYIAPTYVVYIRRDYKTYDTYGELKIDIRSLPMRTALLGFLDGKADGFLFGNSADKVMTQPSISNYILKHSFKELGETDICKIVMSYFAQRGDIRALTRLSKSRGTSLDTLVAYYMPHLAEDKK